MKPKVKALREALKHIDGAWVRAWRDGTVWAGVHGLGEGPDGMERVATALTKAGYQVKCNGKPGTAGEYIVDVLNA